MPSLRELYRIHLATLGQTKPPEQIFPWTQYGDFRGETAEPVSTAVAPSETETLTEVPSKTLRRKSQEEIFKAVVTPWAKGVEQAGRAMAERIERIPQYYEISRSGYAPSEQGYRKVPKEERDYVGAVAAKDVIELIMWYGGPAQTALSGVPGIYQQWMKPSLFKALDKIKPKSHDECCEFCQTEVSSKGF